MKQQQAIIAYFPALHQGYLNFIDNFTGDIYVVDIALSHSLIPRLERDIRAISPVAAVTMLSSIYPNRKVRLLKSKSLEQILKSYEELILPDEDISDELIKGLSPHEQTKVILHPTFLRWDRKLSTVEDEVSPDRIVSSSARNRELMHEAGLSASESRDWWRQVGALIAKDSRPLLVAHNESFPEPVYAVEIFGDPRSNFDSGQYIGISKFIHAESLLIATAAQKGIALKGLSLYVTTFPCPVCAKSIAAAGIKKVYYVKGYSSLDAEDIFKAAKIEVVLVSPSTNPSNNR